MQLILQRGQEEITLFNTFNNILSKTERNCPCIIKII